LAGCGAHSAPPPSLPSPTACPPSVVYGTLKRDIRAYDGTPPDLNAWSLGADHIFLFADADPTAPDSLRERAIRFSRSPGGLDFLFGRLLDPTADEEDIVVVSEILVLFAQEHRPGDDRVSSPKAPAVLKGLKGGRLAEVMRRLDTTLLSDRVRWAAEKSMRYKAGGHWWTP